MYLDRIGFGQLCIALRDTRRARKTVRTAARVKPYLMPYRPEGTGTGKAWRSASEAH